MQQEEMIQKLSDGFNFMVFQSDLGNGSGYELEMKVVGMPTSLGADSFQVSLCGVDPLTGQEIRCRDLSWGFDFAHRNRKSMALSYDGRFELQCEAVMEDGEQILFKTIPIELTCERNAPKVTYSLRRDGSFTRLSLQSNCRGTGRRFLWLSFENHLQRVPIPTVEDHRVCYYLPAHGDVTLETRDSTIRIERER